MKKKKLNKKNLRLYFIGLSMNFENQKSILMSTAQLQMLNGAMNNNNGEQSDGYSKIYDMMYTVLMMSLMSYLMNAFTRFRFNFDFIKNLCVYKKLRKILQSRISCFKRKSELIFEATFISRRNTSTVIDTTKAFDSLIDYLQMNKIHRDVFSKVELNTRKNNLQEIYDPDIDDFVSIRDDVPNINFGFNAGTCIQVERDIFIEFTDRQEHNDETVDGKRVETSRKISVIKVYSYNLTIVDIEEFVNEIYSKYCRKINSKFSKRQYYLNYCGKEKERRSPTWKSFPFNTVKTYDNFFYEKKVELFEQIENIQNSKAEYERVGKPYQINILIYGEDFGCGKTSLLKLLCKMFGNGEKKRHIINLNLAKIKTCSELEDIFLCNDEILGQKIENDERIYIVDEIDKVSDVLYKDDCKNDDSLVEIVKRDMKSFVKTLDKEKGNKLKDLLETAGDFSPKKQSTSDDSLNLGFILSLIDGPIEYHDRIMIFTANNIDKLHPALLRSGRIDLKINLKKATKTIIREIVSHIFLWEGEFCEEIEKMIESIPDYKYSQSDIFTECLNNKKHKYADDNEKEDDIINTLNRLI